MTRTSRKVAAETRAASLAMLGAAALVIPVTAVPIPYIGLFLPTVILCAAIADVLTFAFLAGIYREHGRRSVALLANLYLVTGLLALVLLLTLPTSPLEPPVLRVGPQVGAWVFLSWHLFFPVGALAYAVLRRRNEPTLAPQAARRWWRAILAALVLLVAASVAAILALSDHLPVLVRGTDLRPYLTSGIGPFVLVCIVSAYVAVIRIPSRPGLARDLDVALSLALLGTGLDLTLQMSGTARFEVGWAVARLIYLVSSTFVLIATVRDIFRSRHDGEIALRRYKVLSEIAREIMLFVDARTLCVIEANDAAREAYGRTDLVGLSLDQLQGRSNPPRPDQYAREELERGIVIYDDALRADGSTFPAEIFARATEIEGQPVLAATIRDISEQVRVREELADALDQAVEASRMKTEFVATMSHEIRTPMNGVIGMTELLLRTQLDADQLEYAETVRDSAKALLRIINDILDFSKIEAGKLELEAEVFDPRKVVEGVAKLMRGAADAKAIELHHRFSTQLPAAVCGDAARLRQVLVNLVGNAVKFTERGSVTIAASVAEADGDLITLRFVVEDTGIGIPSAVRERLFEPFVQADGSTTRRFGGTGLGLAISRRLVQLMGGEIGVASEDGAGSRFTFTAVMPLAEAPPAKVPALPRALGELRVLVIDDDSVGRRTIATFVTSWGLVASTAAHGADALDQLAQAKEAERPYDVVITDYVLPHQNGFEIAAAIRREPGRYGAPALLMITAFDAINRSNAAREAGFLAYLVKPVSPSALFDVLGTIDRDRSGSAAPIAVPVTEVPAFREHARILLAEDQPVNRRVATLQLAELGFESDVAVDGREAIDRVQRNDYDLVLMDMHMPNVDGLQAARAIREAEQQTGKHVTIIALTANALDRDRRACIEAGMDDYLPKPLELAALRAMLERWLPMAAAP